jgi:hypothetical protein
MRVMVSFDLQGDSWIVCCLAEDGKRPISPEVRIADADGLVHFLRYVGANDAEIDQVDEAVRDRSRGVIAIKLEPGRKNLLRLPAPWNAELVK